MSSTESSTKLPDVIDPTVAADSVRSQRKPLLKLISHCLVPLADLLLAKFMIPRNVYEKVCNLHLEKSERGGALLDCVEARIRLRASHFTTFIDTLKSEPFLNDLAEILIQSYCTLSLLPPAKRIATISPAISQYAGYLKGVYRNSPISPDSKWPPTPSRKYINLATVKHGEKCRDEFIGHTLHGNMKESLKSRKEISVDEILIPDEEGVAYLKLVLIEGAPGIGKSTLAWELCRRWEQGSMEKYSLTVLLQLREKKVQEIRSTAELFYSCPSKYKDALLDEVSSSNGKGVLFVLDGFDELPTALQKEGFLVDIIRRVDFLPECTVVVTSRPSATAKLFTICCPQIEKCIEILGFTQESVEEYATSIFSSEPERLKKFKAFISASKNPAINSLMYVPLNAAIIVAIYHDSKSDHLLPRTLTQVYTQLCLTILNRHLHANLPSFSLVNKFEDLPAHLYQKFLKLSEIAFDGLKKQEVIFHTLSSDLVHFGFLDSFSSLYGGGSTSYNFLHLTLQEFFTACHISQLSDDDDARLALFSEYASDERWSVVWRFVAGLTEFKFFEEHVNSNVFVTKSKENEVSVKLLFIQCLFEANIKMGGSKLFGLRNINNTESTTQTPLDWYALGYCIANLTSGVSWNVNVEDTTNSANSINYLVCGLKATNTISNNCNINKLCLKACKFERDDLKHFPLRGITDLTLFNYYTFTSSHHLTEALPSMTSLKRLSIQYSTFPNSQCADKLLQQLSKTNVTSLDIEGTDLTESISALKHLIDPLTGTLEELCVGRFNDLSDFSDDPVMPSDSSSDDTEYHGSMCDDLLVDGHDDKELFQVASATSSLKSLKLIYPGLYLPATELQTNTCLTKLEVKLSWYHYHTEDIDKILHNKTLEHLILEMPWDTLVTRDIVKAVSRNSTLKCIEIHYFDYYFEEDLPPKYSDPRIKWYTQYSKC